MTTHEFNLKGNYTEKKILWVLRFIKVGNKISPKSKRYVPGFSIFYVSKYFFDLVAPPRGPGVSANQFDDDEDYDDDDDDDEADFLFL